MFHLSHGCLALFFCMLLVCLVFNCSYPHGYRLCLLLVLLVFDSDSLPCESAMLLNTSCCLFLSNVFSLAAVSFPHCPVCLLLVFLFVKSALFIFLLPGCCVCWHVCLCACCWFSCLFMSACCWCFHICHVCLLMIGSNCQCLPAADVMHVSPASVFLFCHTCALCILLTVHTHPVWQLVSASQSSCLPAAELFLCLLSCCCGVFTCFMYPSCCCCSTCSCILAVDPFLL